MDSDRNKEGVDIRQRKFGLPTWMVNNMERLNYTTNFEKYGSSPPETEGFLAEYMEPAEHRGEDCSPIGDPTGFQESRITPIAMNRHPDDLVRTAVEHSRRRPVLTSPRHDDALVSSPDSTPCATPEPSPVIRRKVSIPHPGDTVLTNPGRWFYFGKLKKYDPNSTPNSTVNKENCDSVDRPARAGVKLVISNFDLNAVSPNSW